MKNISFHDYEVESGDKYSSEMLNRIVSDFVINLTGLFMDYKSLVKDYNEYVINMNTGLDWLTEQAAIMASGIYTISGYSDPTDYEYTTMSKLYGQFYLEELSKEPKITTYMDDKGKYKAYPTNVVYKYNNDILNWVEDESMRKIIDNNVDIWSTIIDEDELYISIACSPKASLTKKASIFEVFPFAGTLIEKIEWKTSSGSFESRTINSKFPVQLVGDFDFNNELRVLMKGIPKDGRYYYSLRYVNIYECDFRDTGYVTFNIGKWSEITAINLNDDYIDNILKLKTPHPIRIQLYYWDSLDTPIWDSESDEYPITSSILIDQPEEDLVLKITLIKTEGVTPVVKYVNVS